MHDLDSVSGVQAATADAMKKQGLVWEQAPRWYTAPLVSSTPGETIQIIDGRLLSTISGRTEFIGPHTDEMSFWTEARHVALDSHWDEPN